MALEGIESEEDLRLVGGRLGNGWDPWSSCLDAQLVALNLAIRVRWVPGDQDSEFIAMGTGSHGDVQRRSGRKGSYGNKKGTIL